MKKKIAIELNKLRKKYNVPWWKDLDWLKISVYEYTNTNGHLKISEDFIRYFHKKLNWELLCKNHTLSEKLMRDFSDKLNWSADEIERLRKQVALQPIKKAVDKP